jgi:polyketide biosynthesis enoyl-CoA hydratase PksH
MNDMSVYQNIVVRRESRVLRVKINRPEQHNSINPALLADLNAALDDAEAATSLRAVVIEGQTGFFCTGMDFGAMVEGGTRRRQEVEDAARQYFRTLKRLSLSSKVIICCVDGRVQAGGIGLLAASDYVISTEQSWFRLSEALFGLLPCTVVPFLIRRTGFQKAYRLTLTAQQVNAREALALGLVDEVDDQLNDALRRFLLKVERVPEKTVGRMKDYFQRMWFLSEQTETVAVTEITELLCDEDNIRRIVEFVEHSSLR